MGNNGPGFFRGNFILSSFFSEEIYLFKLYAIFTKVKKILKSGYNHDFKNSKVITFALKMNS